MDSPETASKDTGDNTNTDVYELQLTQLHQQLIDAMIENEDLKTELNQFKERNKVDQICQELEYEREKNRQLRVQLDQAVQDVTLPSSDCPTTPATERCLGVKLRDYLIELYFDLLSDFNDDGDGDQTSCAELESEQLSVKQLKDNIKRFKKGGESILDVGRNLKDLLTWQSPVLSSLALFVYLYCVWQGWLLTVVSILCLSQLTINYLRSRGWQIHFGVFCSSPSSASSKDSDAFAELALSDKFTLVLQVARQVQVVLGRLADGLEKIKNLLMWRHAEASRKLLITLIMLLMLSCLLSGVVLFRVFGLYVGVKMFIIDYLFKRFPRFKLRHDSVHRLWKQLPTDAMLSDTKTTLGSVGRTILKAPYDHNVDISDADKAFCSTFTLPLSEKPLSGWEGGWRVTLVERDKPFIKAFSRSGRLYLTNSFLCFERFRNPSSKNIMIPLNNITRVEKAKPIAWLPGTGMSIQISVVGYEQPYTFGAIVGRDDCLNQIVQHGVRLRLAWATEHASSSTSVAAANFTHSTTVSPVQPRPIGRDNNGSAPSARHLPASSPAPRDLVDDNFVLVSS